MKNWRKWAKCACIRAVKTIAQTALGSIPAAVSIVEVDWKVVIGTALLSGVISIITSLAGLPEEEV